MLLHKQVFDLAHQSGNLKLLFYDVVSQLFRWQVLVIGFRIWVLTIEIEDRPIECIPVGLLQPSQFPLSLLCLDVLLTLSDELRSLIEDFGVFLFAK